MSVNEELAPLRHEIDNLDNEIIALLGKRFQIVRRVAKIKEEKSFDVVQPDRMKIVKDRCAEMGDQYGLDGNFIRTLYDVIIDYAHSMEGSLIKGDQSQIS